MCWCVLQHDANEYMADDEEPHRTTARNSAMDLFEDLAEVGGGIGHIYQQITYELVTYMNSTLSSS